jgi:CPA2 family monovalent cation:H+ antiporter-2
VVATPDPVKIRKIVDIARTLNPNIECLLRTHSDEEAEFLRQKNLGQVFMGEHELATAMTDYVLSRTASPVSPWHTGSTLPVQRPARG